MIFFTAYESTPLVEYFNTDSRRVRKISPGLVILFAANRYAHREGREHFLPEPRELDRASRWEGRSPYGDPYND